MPASTESAAPRPHLGTGLWAAGFALLCWAWPSIIAKTLPLDPVQIVFYRGWLGSLWAVGFLYLRGGRLSLSGLRVSFWGGVALGFDLVFFFTAIKLTTIANATVIAALQPALLLFLAPWIFGERIRALDVATALVAIGGVALVVRGSSQNGAWSLRGDLFAVLTLFAWTAYLVASKKVAGRIRSSEFAASVTVIATLLITPLALFSEARFSATSLVLPTAPQLGLLATMALFGWGGHLLMNWSLGRIPIWVGGMAALAIPVLTSALAALFLEEPLRPIQLLGMSVVIGSLAIVGVRSPKLVVKDPPA